MNPASLQLILCEFMILYLFLQLAIVGLLKSVKNDETIQAPI
jgi:hypothetical protein